MRGKGRCEYEAVGRAVLQQRGMAGLQSKGYLCERCSTPDNPVVAKIAHHKIYLTRDNINDPRVSLSWENLEALCQDCHNREHHRSKRKQRYTFDANGNLIYPPHAER